MSLQTRLISVETAIQNCLATQQSHGLISDGEAKLARASLTYGSERHTIGYELEVCVDAFDELHFPGNSLSADSKICDEGAIELQARAFKVGFNTGTDEVFEISSPPSTHPYALYIAQLGVVRSGLTPYKPKGTITEHISLGIDVEPEKFEDYLQILRTTELLGASTPQRMLEPATKAALAEISDVGPDCYSYAVRGSAGLSYDPWLGNIIDQTWFGANARFEFRSLQYRQPQQLLIGLDALYYLTLGMHGASDSQRRKLYEQFRNAYTEQTEKLRLPSSSEAQTMDWGDYKVFTTYFKPYAALCADPKASYAIRDAARSAILAIREEVGMDKIWSPFENPYYRRLARLNRHGFRFF